MAGTKVGCGMAVYDGTPVYNRCEGFEIIPGFSRGPVQDDQARQVLIAGCIEKVAGIRLCRVTSNHQILRIPCG
jgi:hypothetical protein